MDDLRKKLLFRAWHRGTREMDLLLGNFAAETLPLMRDDELKEFTLLLEHQDPDLYDWLSGKKPIDGIEPQSLLRQLKARYV